MLILERKKNQTIKIDGGIEITIICIRGTLVRVGVQAPRELKVIRGELDPRDANGLDHSKVEIEQ